MPKECFKQDLKNKMKILAIMFGRVKYNAYLYTVIIVQLNKKML
jgi:hypothetical protein